MTKLAIFDCDGTLVDSGATIHRAIGMAFDAHGLACPPRAVASKVIGLSLVDAIGRLAPEGDATAMAESYKQAFIGLRGAGEVEEPLYDGIAALLDAMEADGWLLGVATGKSERGLRHCLDSHSLRDRFVTLQTADTNPSKPDPGMAMAAMAAVGAAPERTIFIGDTAWDMGCARAADCGAIGVGWGYHDDAELIGAGAHHVAHVPGEVTGFAAQWIEGGQ